MKAILTFSTGQNVLSDEIQSNSIIIFLNRNEKQILQKAAKHGIDADDATQSVCEIYLNQISKYDPNQGTVERYIFGYFEKILNRQKVNPLRYAVSLDDAKVEIDFAAYCAHQKSIVEEDDFESMLSTSDVPGSEALMEVADLISGKSAAQLADDYGLSKRQIGNKLFDLKEISKIQFSLPFKERKK